MATPGDAPSIAHEPPPVKLLAAILYREPAVLQAGLAALEQALAPHDYVGAHHPFDLTEYYRGEMGPGLSRVLVSFAPLRPAGCLVEAKWQAHGVEALLSREGRRQINVDVGYLDLFKLVLASFKARGNKLYLDRGVWADLTLYYERGSFHALPWSFPDFQTSRYYADLLAIRRLYQTNLRCGP